MHEINENKSKAQIYASPEEALLKTKRIWEVLADQPDLSKLEAYELLGLQKDFRNCPCCQYNEQKVDELGENSKAEKEDCHFCPLYPESDFGCDQEGEPYNRWVDSSFISEGSDRFNDKRFYAAAFLSLVNSTLSKNGDK